MAEWMDPDSASGWNNNSYAIDNNLGTNAYQIVNDNTWSGWLTISLDAPITATQVRLNSSFADPLNIIQVDVYRNDAWESIYNGAIFSGWKTLSFAAGTVDKFRVRAHNGSFSKNEAARVRDSDFYGDPIGGEEPYGYIM